MLRWPKNQIWRLVGYTVSWLVLKSGISTIDKLEGKVWSTLEQWYGDSPAIVAYDWKETLAFTSLCNDLKTGSWVYVCVSWNWSRSSTRLNQTNRIRKWAILDTLHILFAGWYHVVLPCWLVPYCPSYLWPKQYPKKTYEDYQVPNGKTQGVFLNS